MATPRPARDRRPTDTVVDRDALDLALRTLSPDQREVVVLRYFFDLTIEGIAARTGAREGTVQIATPPRPLYLRSAIDAANEGSIDR